ncbi:MAG: bifunctional DNA-formamidopyrimidine glycosylase/DNA-(apurinic or apyrimidinic site) lyase [Chromatiales bacterium]|jgi:formamidopyrimidine-DNA glycosylase
MPELPEVETARRGLEPHLIGRRITGVRVRQPRLRWPVPADLERVIPGQRVLAVERRAKYLLLRLDGGTLMVHLGMSGSLRVLGTDVPPGPHDHVDLLLGAHCLRLHDPRRFGAVLWTAEDPLSHPRLRELGPEPLEAQFDGTYLRDQAARRRVAIKSLIMDGRVVVGVGNIYANEALFLAGILPARPCRRIAQHRLERLAGAIKAVLSAAIEQGGTTLRDFVREDGRPGYFEQALRVYGRRGLPCPTCGEALRERRIGQRSSVFCPRCQR